MPEIQLDKLKNCKKCGSQAKKMTSFGRPGQRQTQINEIRFWTTKIFTQTWKIYTRAWGTKTPRKCEYGQTGDTLI